MANLLDKYRKHIIGSDNKDDNFNSIISSHGDFSKSTGLKAILESWENILRTPLGTADHDPEYGSRLRELIFEHADESTKEKIVDEVTYRLMSIDNRAEIEETNVFFLKNKKGFVVDVTASYRGETGNTGSITVDETTT